MPLTKRNRLLRHTTYKKQREYKISVGPEGSVRAKEDLGLIYISSLSQSVSIEGCDWHGALAIYNYLPVSHRSICENDEYFFVMPETFTGELVRSNAVFIILFHHIYNYFLIKEPWITPPFRSPIKVKYTFLQKVFNCDDFDLSVFDPADLQEAQQSLKQGIYKTWSDFIAVFKTPWAKEFTPIIYSYEDRLNKLDIYCKNSAEILEFLKMPVDSVENIITEIVPSDKSAETNLDEICNIVLEKIDQHIIYHQTGVKPIAKNWVRELDLYLFP
jgi:hypothetical protein